MGNLTPQKIREKQDKGTYFYCNEKYVVGHKCQPQKVFLLEILPKMEEEEGGLRVKKEDLGRP